MSARLIVLASGSSGNASLLQVGEFGLLVDCGLGPQELGARLIAAGESWQSVSAVLLTHTHSDHWNRLTFAHLRRLNIPLIAHPRHHDDLSSRREYEPLRRAGLTRSYAEAEWFEVTPELMCRPIRVPHDADPTFAFRFEARGNESWSLGFASDLGRVTEELQAAFAGVDVLAIEYNHDVRMQRSSRRPRMLIDRVLGDHGHLSNVQAAELTSQIATTTGLRALVQLHLSRDCNRRDLAAAAGKAAAPGVTVVTAAQFEVSPPVLLTGSPKTVAMVRRSVQQTLPGLAPL